MTKHLLRWTCSVCGDAHIREVRPDQNDGLYTVTQEWPERSGPFLVTIRGEQPTRTIQTLVVPIDLTCGGAGTDEIEEMEKS